MNYVETDERKEHVNEALKNMYQEDILPSKLSQDYHIVSCLTYTETRKVYIVEQKTGRNRYILKCRTGNDAELLKKEYAALTSIEEEFVPKAVSCFSEQDVTYLLREYIAGETLEQEIDRTGVYDSRRAIRAMLDICHCVQVLHKHVPPLIHRDIKPQNILAAKDGTYKFIDMDTIREYKKEGSYDTVCMGTRETAAPEQFGFRQTSIRSDIYSLGILFLFLLTGGYTVHCPEWKDLPVSIRRVIRKCLAFDPKNRYSSVAALCRELKRLERCSERRGVVAFQIAMVFVVVMAAALIRKYCLTDAQNQNESVPFENPQIETAVRQTLGMDEHTTIHPSDLDGITTLILCGDRIFQSWEEHEAYHDNYFSEFNHEEKAVSPANLSDLQYFSNLHTLVLDNQGIEDISVLEKLSLNRLSLRKNRITSLNGMESNPELSILIISDNPIPTIEALSNLHNLRQLNISNTDVQSIAVLEGMPLVRLDCSFTYVTDYSTLSALEYLTVLQISNADSETIAYINTLKNLEILGLFESDLEALEEISNLQRLECMDVGSCREIKSLEGIEAFPKLNYLGIANTEIQDISVIATLQQLEMLDITDTGIDTLSPIADCKRLHTIFIDSGKEAGIQQLQLEENVEIIVNE